MFMGEWDEENITNLIVILNCFFLVLGLKINLHKSKLYGLGVPMQDIENTSGNNMNRHNNREDII